MDGSIVSVVRGTGKRGSAWGYWVCVLSCVRGGLWKGMGVVCGVGRGYLDVGWGRHGFGGHGIWNCEVLFLKEVWRLRDRIDANHIYSSFKTRTNRKRK